MISEVFYNFWVVELWGSNLLALFGTAGLFSLFMILGRMSWQLLSTILLLYFLVFGVGFYGMVFYLLVFLFSAIYFGFSIYKFFIRD